MKVKVAKDILLSQLEMLGLEPLGKNRLGRRKRLDLIH